MIASGPVRLLSLAIVALAVLVGMRGIVGGIGLDAGGVLEHSNGSESSSDGERTTAVVEFVVDGDTVEVTTRAGKKVRVRFLGISAPEIPQPGKPGECYGYPSARHLKQLLPAGTQVTLVGDPTQGDVDTYGRWLRYVEADRRDVGRAQIRAGAAAARDSSDPVSRHRAYQMVEGQARGRGAGMWSSCR